MRRICKNNRPINNYSIFRFEINVILTPLWLLISNIFHSIFNRNPSFAYYLCLGLEQISTIPSSLLGKYSQSLSFANNVFSWLCFSIYGKVLISSVLRGEKEERRYQLTLRSIKSCCCVSVNWTYLYLYLWDNNTYICTYLLYIRIFQIGSINRMFFWQTLSNTNLPTRQFPYESEQ